MKMPTRMSGIGRGRRMPTRRAIVQTAGMPSRGRKIHTARLCRMTIPTAARTRCTAPIVRPQRRPPMTSASAGNAVSSRNDAAAVLWPISEPKTLRSMSKRFMT